MTTINADAVLSFFQTMNQIPRTSGQEEALSNWLVQFAKDRHLQVEQDQAWNVIIRKPASPGYENKPAIILQGHMDMVGEKAPTSEHDFSTDPIECIVDGEWMHANQTTLGADNGIGVAMALAILDDDSLEHGPITALFTTNEETGMDGAQAIKKGQVDGQYLLNIDTEIEGEFIVSCAGGCRVDVEIPCLREWRFKRYNAGLHIKVDGLLGGHSGMEIHKQRANANQILARILYRIDERYSFQLGSFQGGTKHNAIPRQAEATIALRQDDVEAVTQLVAHYAEQYKQEFSPQDSDLQVTLTSIAPPESIYAHDTEEALIHLLYLAPHGVYSMSQSLPNLVETSNNIAIVQEEAAKIKVLISIRSSSESALHFMKARFRLLANTLGVNTRIVGEYPAWQYDAGSMLEKQAIALYTQMTGTEPRVTAVHAGLECGLLKNVLPDTQMISFGPTITGAHTPQEKVHLPSVERIYTYLVALLKELK